MKKGERRGGIGLVNAERKIGLRTLRGAICCPTPSSAWKVANFSRLGLDPSSGNGGGAGGLSFGERETRTCPLNSGRGEVRPFVQTGFSTVLLARA